MAYSKINIINLALFHIKQKAISAVTEKTPMAEIANVVWEYCLNEVFERALWNFAKTEAELTADGAYTSTGVWDYRYTRPSSCIRIIRCRDEDGEEVEYEEMGDYLYSNYDNTSYSLYCEYTTIITDPTKYTSAFINCLAYRLAAAMAEKLKSSDENDMLGKYEEALIDAKGLNQSRQYIKDDTGTDSWVNAGRGIA